MVYDSLDRITTYLYIRHYTVKQSQNNDYHLMFTRTVNHSLSLDKSIKSIFLILQINI